MGQRALVFATGHALFVFPVGSDTKLGTLVHLIGSNLYFHGSTLGAKHCGVERLIQVEFGCCDVVLETAGHGIPPCVNRAECCVAIPDGADQNADAREVVNIVEVTTAVHHFLIDRVILLGPSTHLSFNFRGFEIVIDRIDYSVHEGIAFRRTIAHKRLDFHINLGVQHSTRQVLELPLHSLDAQAVCERCVDVESFLGFFCRRFRCHKAPGSSVVKTIRQLHNENSNVFRHSDNHFPDCLSLGVVAVLELV